MCASSSSSSSSQKLIGYNDYRSSVTCLPDMYVVPYAPTLMWNTFNNILEYVKYTTKYAYNWNLWGLGCKIRWSYHSNKCFLSRRVLFVECIFHIYLHIWRSFVLVGDSQGERNCGISFPLSWLLSVVATFKWQQGEYYMKCLFVNCSSDQILLTFPVFLSAQLPPVRCNTNHF